MKNVLCLISIILFSSCGNNELDRSKATGIITDFYNYPVAEMIQIESVKIGELAESESQLYNQGNVQFITENGTVIQANENSESSFSILGNNLTFNEVTGIRTLDSKKIVIVDFTEKRIDITPFGRKLNHQESDLVEKQVTMELYDDGWRITSIGETANGSTDIPISKQSNTTPEKTTEEISEEDTDDEEIIGESSASFFLLKKAFTEEGENFVAVDYIGEDGSNNNTKLRIFKIANDFNTSDYCGSYKKSGRIKNFSDLATLKNDSLKLYIVVKNNTVECIEFTDLPELKPVKIKDLPRKPKSAPVNKRPKDTIKPTEEDTLEPTEIDTLRQQVKDTVG